jgi:hypothetical protein
MARRVGRIVGDQPEDRGGDTDLDDWTRQWLNDNGLWNDNFGMPPGQYDLYPTSTKYQGPR